jgi:hypothetical protein
MMAAPYSVKCASEEELDRILGEQLVNTYISPGATVKVTKGRLAGREFRILRGCLVRGEDGIKKSTWVVEGLPFPAESLKVVGEVLEPITIRVDGYDPENKNLLPAADTGVPFNGQTQHSKKFDGKYYTHAKNVIWEFAQAGISFEIDESQYVTQQPGARIRFTDRGVELQWINVLPRVKK